MVGMVMLPLPTVLATEEPEYIPSKALEITATLAGPPTLAPAMEFARSTKKVPMPVFSRKEPRMINSTIKEAQTVMGEEKMPQLRL